MTIEDDEEVEGVKVEEVRLVVEEVVEVLVVEDVEVVEEVCEREKNSSGKKSSAKVWLVKKENSFRSAM